jgi:hypothetical protein
MSHVSQIMIGGMVRSRWEVKEKRSVISECV